MRGKLATRKKTILFFISFLVVVPSVFAINIPLFKPTAVIHRTMEGNFIVQRKFKFLAIGVNQYCSTDADCTGYCNEEGTYYYGNGQCLELSGGTKICYYDNLERDSPECGAPEPCSDVCTLGDTRCYADYVEECQDWDDDPCTDGWQFIQDCEGDCQNAQCVGCNVKRYCKNGNVWKQYKDCSTSKIETCGTNQECANGECVLAAKPKGTTSLQFLGAIMAKIARIFGG